MLGPWQVSLGQPWANRSLEEREYSCLLNCNIVELRQRHLFQRYVQEETDLLVWLEYNDRWYQKWKLYDFFFIQMLDKIVINDI